MTSNSFNLDDIDEVLSEFAIACPVPTASELDEWCSKYPASAVEMHEYAEIARENFESEEYREDPELDAIVDCIFATGMRRIQADRRMTLPELIKAKGSTIPTIAAAIGIDRDVLADIVAGRLMPPVGPRLVTALSSVLAAARQAIREAVMASFDAPRVGHANSDPQTSVRPRTWAESVAASNMASDRKAHWLGED